MNRPTILNYEFVNDTFESKFDYGTYTEELEANCNELEKELKDLKKEYGVIEEAVEQTYKELYLKDEQAIDKIVWCIKNNIVFLANTNKTEDEWKEWFKEEWY